MSDTRPNPMQWIGYAFGRRLPATMRDWVANDLTGDHAFRRHLIRGMVPFVPIFVLFTMLPGPAWLRGATLLLGLLLALFYCAAYMGQNRARRLHVHGLPTDLISPRNQAKRAEERAAYEATYRAATYRAA